jgi:HD-GYP domain-containing protein (c-di-GMP phosphodiesterase class II)
VTQKTTTSDDSEYELIPEFEETASGAAPNAKYAVKVLDFFSNPALPYLILDTELMIVNSSLMTQRLFAGYYEFSKKPFINLFHLSLELSELRDLVSSLHSAEQGYSWSGTLKHAAPRKKTLHTRTVIIPFFSAERAVAGFQVLFEDVTESYKAQLHSMYKTILEAAKLKDNDTGMHDERVSYYSKKMSEYLYSTQRYPQINPDFIDDIGFLAAMHDVGKIGTPDYILHKPGKLTEQEWEIMREHTINGTFILSSYPVPMAKEIAMSHHERWDGTGYPYKLEAKMIPLTARIVAIADVYDALRMKRSYKEECTHEEATHRIIAGSGTQFDPELVEVFSAIQSDFNDIWNLLKDTADSNAFSRERSRDLNESI